MIGVLVLPILTEGRVRLEQGVEVGASTFTIPSGTQEILIGVLMILILIFQVRSTPDRVTGPFP